MPGVIKEAGMKYILTSFWKHHPSKEAKVRKAANMTAYGLSRLQVGKFAPPLPTSHPIQGFPPPPPEVSTVPPLDSEDTSMSGESSFMEQTEAVPPATLTTRCFPAAQHQHMASKVAN
ncbi:uncharacterized protein EI90DRAFT_3123634 [Cantharellus anzutake]|uniref:uncharacterized protein n=1 Tax=Cantharellus anzutake TaxID=1750568 RepID=UPI0019076D31|nr:uncharacterized protein EI90DRAFT_3123634 [Cantharellus anzutake]KAF8331450.1 hypothetical protein EI90DRAFT_3123634 [Cantharellus anzutake]